MTATKDIRTKWSFQLANREVSTKRNSKLDPPGFGESVSGDGRSSRRDKTEDQSEKDAQIANLKLKKAWDVALAPGKSIPMNAIMLYMSGNSIQIFSVLVTVMLLWNSLKAIMGVNTVFSKFANTTAEKRPQGIAALVALASDPLMMPKLVYVLLQCGCLGLGVWKCGGMGLLPTTQSDWLAFMDPKVPVDWAY
ncbi:hypothetical protein DFS34DRAFT_417493 [Phlyctochytrium arcticum]|nr:hypothetical protein DFS34DRAFT_417493 [Phlyctochytrium arcticum]